MLRGRMTIRTLLIVLALLPLLPLDAQDSEYPTLQALADLQIPALDYVDVAQRFDSFDQSLSPPAESQDYQIGDRQSFYLPIDDQWTERLITTELRGMTKNALVWVQESAEFTRREAQEIADRVEADVISALTQLFNFSMPPGIDGDPRLFVIMMRQPRFSRPAFFDQRHLRPRTLHRLSNQREMMVFNLAIGDDFELPVDYIVATIAHEYQHILLHHRDAGELRWLDEAFSSFVEHYIGSPYVAEWLAEGFMPAPNTGLTHMLQGDNRWAKYGAGGLFAIYLADRFGDSILASLHAEAADGWAAIDKALRDAAGLSADEVFADWVLANYYQDAKRGFGYSGLDDQLVPINPAPTVNSFPARHSGRLPQYSAEYLALNVADGDKLSIRLTQPSEARFVELAPYEGERFYYAVTTDRSSSRLTRSIELSESSRPVWLRFRVWHDLAEHYEFGYFQISADGGDTWSVLPGNHTRPSSYYGLFYDNCYTGRSGRWLLEAIDLSEFAPGNIILRFEVLTETVTSYKGMAIDDLRIETIDFHDGFESANSGWIEEGWIRTDNRLPNNTWLQVVQETEAGLEVTRSLMAGSGERIVDLLPGVDSVVVAISPVVLQTALESEYALEVNLLDADGNEIVVEFSCQLTTTAGLNFRDAPNGNKIGLVPQGAALWALDRSGDWFQVEYESQRGWIHGGYVTRTGNCP